MNSDLAITESTAIRLFEANEIDKILFEIEKEVRSFVPVLDSVKGRKEIASLARKVSASKVVLFNAGKALTKEWKDKAKLVDESKRVLTTRLDALRDEVRKPLTDYENAEKAKNEADKLVKQIETDYQEATSINDLINRERAIEEKERIAREKEESERLEREKIAYEQKIKDDAIIEEQRKQETENLRLKQEAQNKIDEAKRIEAEAIAEKERLKREKIESENQKRLDDKRIEKERIEALEKAETDKQNAILKAQEDARIESERIEKVRLAKIEDERIKTERIASDKTHRKEINNNAVFALVNNGFSRDDSKKIVTLIAKNIISHVTINY